MPNNKKLKTFNELLYENEKKYADLVYLRQPIDGIWHDITWQETMLQARKITAFLKSLGLKKGDKVTVFSKNCAEWLIADFAIALGGFVSVPLFAAQHRDNIHYVLEHAEVKAIFVGKLDNWAIQESGIPESIPRIAFPYENPMPAQYQWDDILSKFEPDMDNYIPDLDDLYTIVYTSGTTGNPKGAMITFKALANLKDPIYEMGIIDKQEHNVLFSYLPLGHITERIVVEFCSIIRKTTVCFSESLATFAKNLQETSPTSFMCVPRLWTQFQKNILAQIPQEKLDVMLAHPTEGEVVKKQLKAALGLSRADPIMSGSAPLSPALINWYKKIGINILEGYGRTEDCAFCAFNTPGHEIVGTIGRPNPGVEVKIDDNGELLTRSKMMMVGYYKDPETTKTVFTEDGFLRTGDKARFDENHNLIIMGRVNDSFKTDKGEFVNPIPIEHKFSHNNLLEQICLIGLNLPQPVLLAVLSEPAMKMDRDEIERSLKETFDAINPDLTKYEKIVHIFLVKEGWTPENALLTPTLKMKRNAIHDKYIDLALKNIDTPEVIIWE